MRSSTTHAPPGWPQRAGRFVPFPPGEPGEEWEIVRDGEAGGEQRTYQVNTTTGAVYREEDGRWYQPTWEALPQLVRGRILISKGL